MLRGELPSLGKSRALRSVLGLQAASSSTIEGGEGCLTIVGCTYKNFDTKVTKVQEVQVYESVYIPNFGYILSYL